MIATENGYSLYLGGNGGVDPVHGLLFATDIDEDTVIKYLDRYLMYYILTADRLERAAVWQAKLSTANGGGPVDHLMEVIIDDKLGICEELDKRMNHLVESYHDEWAEVVEFVDVRGQLRPADWPKDGQPQTNWEAPTNDIFAKSEKSWVQVGKVSNFHPNVGSAILYGTSQLAVFNNVQRGEWYCTQNMCPHKQAFVLSQGIFGDAAGTAKVACPLHKKTFSLADGGELGGDLKKFSLSP